MSHKSYSNVKSYSFSLISFYLFEMLIMGNQLALEFLAWKWLHAKVPWSEIPELTSKNNTLASAQQYFKAQNSSIAELQRRSYWSRWCISFAGFLHIQGSILFSAVTLSVQ